MQETYSKQLFEKAQELIPGGVNSPVRACKNVDSIPLFIKSAKGCEIIDADNNTYIDYVLSWGPMILGHAHPDVTAAVAAAAERGTSYGAPCEDEIKLASEVINALPSVEMVRMVNSGTEATMSALRLARAVTKKDKVLKFIGCYHGHADAFLAAAGSGMATLSIPGTPGVPSTVVADTLLAPYNDLEAVKEIFAKEGSNMAAVIVEPCAANMGLVPPKPNFLETLRELCTAHGALLIFDEVITGFRLAYGGAQSYFGIDPDLTTLGKIIGGGLPVGAYGGKREYMQRVAPSGDVYQAGTLSGNPLAMAAGLATLNILKNSDYSALEARTKAFAKKMEDILREKGLQVNVPALGPMFCPFFSAHEVCNFDDVKNTDIAMFTKFYKALRNEGIYIAPASFEAAMMSFVHTDEHFEKTLDAVRRISL